MWLTSAGRLPVDPVTAAGHYRNTIQGAKATITTSLTLSFSPPLIPPLSQAHRVLARMQTAAAVMQCFRFKLKYLRIVVCELLLRRIPPPALCDTLFHHSCRTRSTLGVRRPSQRPGGSAEAPRPTHDRPQPNRMCQTFLLDLVGRSLEVRRDLQLRA